MVNSKYVLPPNKISTGKYLIGAFRCSLWNNKNRPGCWDSIKKYPERQPLLGWYNEGDTEVTDWEIKYATEHGISFFVECWFRKKNNEGKPVENSLGHWLESLPQARYRDSIKFMILWENVNGISSGIASENDLMENLLPFWIDNYFKRSNYLIIEGKPVLMVYGYKKFVDELGGKENTIEAVRRMRQACMDAGFKGLWLIAEHHVDFNQEIPLLREVGFDAITSYHWPSFSGLMPQVPSNKSDIVNLQEECWCELDRISQLPSIPTVSMGWDSEPWGSTYYKGQWFIEPNLYKELCERAKIRIDSARKQNEFSNMVLLDNWNEFGEGHYIFPTKQFRFGYIDAVREVFSNSTEPHQDLVPDEVDLGPLETKILKK